MLSQQPSGPALSVGLLSDNFYDVMSATVKEVESELQLARQLLEQCRESFNSLVSFFGENAQSLANDAVFWSDIIPFVQKFTACQRTLRKQTQVSVQQDLRLLCSTATLCHFEKQPFVVMQTFLCWSL